MGQRHQIIVVLPSVQYREGNPNNKEAYCIAIHHQWLYGATAVYLLNSFLRFFRAMKRNSAVPASTPTHKKFPYSMSHNPEDIVAASYAIDKTSGYYHQTHILNTANPEHFDNNDGVTVIDLRTPTTKYCFMSVHGFEGGEGKGDYQPHSAEEYLNIYNVQTKIKVVGARVLTKTELDEIIKIAKKEKDENKEEKKRVNV